MRPSGHRVLITGGAKGIGLALARRFHAAGNQLVLVGREEAALAAAAGALPGTRTEVADVASGESRSRLAASFPEVDVLVNNAGIQLNGEFAGISTENVEREVGGNLLAPVLLAREFLPRLRSHDEAAIVNVTSVLALVPKQSASVYCATKAALHSFSQSLRWQLEGTAVRVFELMPPLVDTAMAAGRGEGKISPEAVAAEFWAGFLADRYEVRVGKARAAALIARLAPPLAERILRRS